MGSEIIDLHHSYSSLASFATFPKQGSNEITFAQFIPDDKGNVWINEEQCFTGIDDEAAAYSIGGTKVLAQWLSDRRGRTLLADDVVTFLGIIAAVARLTDIPGEIDELH